MSKSHDSTVDFAISVRNLTKDFQIGLRGVKLRAIDNLSIDIPRGQVFGLLGPNGCGKSTTLKIILGLVSATSGDIRIFDESFASLSARRRTGFLPEAPYFHKFLTGRELVHFCAQLSGIAECNIRNAVDEALSITSMMDAADRNLGTYSKGMLQRIGLAQAIVHDPELVILDEPTAGVDPVGSLTIGNMIRTMRDRGKTVILCSHLLGQVEQICDRIAIMDRGKLVLEGSVDEILAHKDQHILTVDALTYAGESAVKETLVSHGSKLISITHPRRSLEQLFRELVSGRNDT